MTPNVVALFALLFWPVLTLWLYHVRPINQATLWSILGAQLILPVGASIKFEMIPAFDKNSIPNLAALLGCMVTARRATRSRNRIGLAEVLLSMLILGPFI